jgi:phosphoglycolate phosphatase
MNPADTGNVRLAVFDCDGTLVDGQAPVCDAMEAAFAAAGLPAPDRVDIRRIVGLSLPAAMRRLAPDAAPEQWGMAVDTYRSAFRMARLEGRVAEPAYPGIVDLLGRLRAGGWQLGVATGKSARGLQSCLSALGLLDHFRTLQTADHHPSKPHPAMLEQAMADALADPGGTVMIGDTMFDMEMARAAGVRALGVAWGYHSRQELLDSGAEAVAETAGQLEEWLR